jgi:hypothetical protein
VKPIKVMGVVLIFGLSLFGGVAMAATIGTSGDDAIKGTKASEKIKDRGGNDVVRARVWADGQRPFDRRGRLRQDLRG